MHPDIRIELGRQRQAALIAAGEAGRAVRLARADERGAPSRLTRITQSLLARLRREDERPRHLELERAIVIRTSGAVDRPALERLAALDSRKLPEGWFLLAEIEGELVAAAPIDVDVEPLSDPFRPMAEVRELLRLQADHIRRRRVATPARPVRRAGRALSDPA
jgi:hypothetical protein